MKENLLKNTVKSSFSSADQADTVLGGTDSASFLDSPTAHDLSEEFKNIQDAQEKKIAMIGSRDLSMSQIKIIEMIGFGLTAGGNTVITSGGYCGTNYATIKGALRGNSDRLKVILPQTLQQQIKEVQDQLIGVKNIVEHPEWAHMLLADASRLCNQEIIYECQQLICFLYRDSNTLKDSLKYAHSLNKVVTTFYLD
ncbi:MAG: DNA recombination-mediator protein A [Candidatus Caenarcaniphilales bacterium]|nr:DNA recombination-mediator protein A [Candidatus Caenarcaniphilales bacterium]